MPVSPFLRHLTAGASVLSHACCCADAAGEYATDGSVAVLPHGRNRQRAVAPLSRSATENAAIPAFPDRTTASHRSTKVTVVMRRVWRLPAPQRSGGAGRTRARTRMAVKVAAQRTVSARGA